MLEILFENIINTIFEFECSFITLHEQVIELQLS